ncbi:hypothetical protein [Mycobacterium sp. C31M]
MRGRIRPMMARRLDDVTARIAALREFADSLQAALSQLDDLPDRSTPCDPGCTFLSERHHAQLVD